MSLSNNQFPGLESKWDIPHIVRNDSNLGVGFVGSFKLAPTALLPGNWVLYFNNSGVYGYVWDIDLVSDTPIEYQLFYNGIGDPNFTQQTPTTLSQGFGTPGVKFEAQVAAPAGHSSFLTGGFIPANTLTHVFNKSWLRFQNIGGINLTTSLVACNMYCTFYWCERTD